MCTPAAERNGECWPSCQQLPVLQISKRERVATGTTESVSNVSNAAIGGHSIYQPSYHDTRPPSAIAFVSVDRCLRSFSTADVACAILLIRSCRCICHGRFGVGRSTVRARRLRGERQRPGRCAHLAASRRRRWRNGAVIVDQSQPLLRQRQRRRRRRSHAVVSRIPSPSASHLRFTPAVSSHRAAAARLPHAHHTATTPSHLRCRQATAQAPFITATSHPASTHQTETAAVRRCRQTAIQAVACSLTTRSDDGVQQLPLPSTATTTPTCTPCSACHQPTPHLRHYQCRIEYSQVECGAAEAVGSSERAARSRITTTHTAPSVASTRRTTGTRQEVELLLHLLVCHPMAGGVMESGKGKGVASEWGLFSINLPGRVGAECEKKWKELSAAGRLWSEDSFDYMRWYEQQRLRSITIDTLKGDAGKAVADPVTAASTTEPFAQLTDTPQPAVINRKRVSAPPPQPAADNEKSELAASPQPPRQKVEAAVSNPEAGAEQPKQSAKRDVLDESDDGADKKTKDSELPLRKKTVRFQQDPATLQRVKAAHVAAAVAEPAASATEAWQAADTVAARRPKAALSRRPPPTRVAIPASPPRLASHCTPSAFWPPRPPRMPIAASTVPSTIRPHSTSTDAIKRLDTSQLTVGAQTHTLSKLLQ